MILDTWFTVEQIDPDTYAISEYRHWEEPHCYLLCGTDSAILIDTGLGVSDIKCIVDQLTQLPVTVVTTHAHWDHIGGHKYFQKIAIHELDAHWLAGQFPLPLQAVRDQLTAKPCDFPETFRPEHYQVFQGRPQHILQDGEQLSLGNRTLTVVHTPGHSPGHCCFYEPERKYLYSGDLVYHGCLDAFYPSTDPQQFRHSIQKIQALEIQKLLPGHFQLNVSADLIKRIASAFDHLHHQDTLHHGSGCFSYDDFQIHI